MFGGAFSAGCRPGLLGSCRERGKAQQRQYAYGMGHSSDVPEVRSVLGMLPRHAAAAGTVGGSGSGQYTAQGMSSDVPEVQLSGYAS
jgi:hypothetical protein